MMNNAALALVLTLTGCTTVSVDRSPVTISLNPASALDLACAWMASNARATPEGMDCDD